MRDGETNHVLLDVITAFIWITTRKAKAEDQCTKMNDRLVLQGTATKITVTNKLAGELCIDLGIELQGVFKKRLQQENNVYNNNVQFFHPILVIKVIKLLYLRGEK